MFKLISGLIVPTAGEITICGESVKCYHNKILRKVGILIDIPSFYEHLTAKDNLEIHLKYMDINGDALEVLSLVGLE